LSKGLKPPATVRLAIREFGIPCPRTGSIDAQSGYGASSLDGIEIHQRVQKMRAEASAVYTPEVKLARTFQRGGYEFLVEGRMDGIFAYATPRIEEIKSSFNLEGLVKALSGNPFHHPYCLQLLTYGYFYYLDSERTVIPELTFYLVSSRNQKAKEMEIRLDVEAYERWLDLRLDELVAETILAEKRAARRRKISTHFAFPFEQRRVGQSELIDTVEQGLAARQRMLIQAPTGLGKTAGVLYPSLKEALRRGQQVIYVTPKNSQHTVAEEAVEHFQAKGSAVKSLTITAKSKLCMKAEPLCNPVYCEYAKNYYDKVAENNLVAELAKKKKLSARMFKALAEKYEVCPFALQLEAVPEADTVICDYNYVFAPGSALRTLSDKGIAKEGKPNLVIDEAHNLPARAMGYYSPVLSSVQLEKMRIEVRALPKRFAKEMEELLDECIEVLVACKPPGANQHQHIDPDLDLFLDQDSKLRGFLSRYLESDVEIKPKDVVLRLCFYWSEFTGVLEQISGLDHAEFFTTFQPDATGGIVKVTCCDASQMLKPGYDEYENVVGFSATLKPFDYYSRLSGLDSPQLKLAEFESPFHKSQRKLLIIPQISTKFSERERNYARIAETISRIAEVKPGNYLAFFPSFDFLERVLAFLKVPKDFKIIRQERFMKTDEINGVLAQLREESGPTLVFAVQGGVFSEGVDYPGQMVVGAFVIGPPLPHFDVERESMKKYYEQHYQQGFDYAYAFPAMAKSVQAAGRVIRTEQDRGVIILMDSRFLDRSYVKSMPKDWFQKEPQELVSKSILQEIKDFWDPPSKID
jgi:DNA excision repair protein ERCC-2